MAHESNAAQPHKPDDSTNADAGGPSTGNGISSGLQPGGTTPGGGPGAGAGSVGTGGGSTGGASTGNVPSGGR